MSLCSRCGSEVAPNALSMSLDGSGMICSACSLGQRSAQDKAGLRKTYVTGAIVLVHILADSANDGDLDAVLLRQGRELELSRDLAGARKAYYELIVKAPQSSRVPYAYLAFADLFFDEAEHDDPSKLPLAQQAYQKVLAYRPPANLAYAFAWHRLGVIASRMGDDARARDAQRKTLAAVKQYPGLAAASPLAEAARRELAAVAGHLGP